MSVGFVLLAAVVVLGTAGQVALKYALRENGRRSGGALGLVRTPAMLAWGVCYAAASVLWLLSLRSLPLSQAFPILGLQFALIPIAARGLLGEAVSSVQWAGILVIVVGVALVGQT